MNLAGLLDGKTAFVTGGAAGLGVAIVTAFAKAGAHGIAFDRRPPEKALPKGWRFSAGDVRQEASIAEALAGTKKEHGGLDLLVANAGIAPPWRESESTDLDEWDEAFAINARGVMATIKHAIPLMKSRAGSIIIMASVNALIGHARQAAYVASKHAALGIARSTAQDLGRYGIRVNALCPGPIATAALLERLHNRAQGGGPSEKEAMQRYNQTALGRIATAEEVAHAALFLASDLSSGITGQAITVDAGAN
jgi:NAD(P)-dependent dehydrogenase (short-subunit alcohol dehydrogenase family)